MFYWCTFGLCCKEKPRAVTPHGGLVKGGTSGKNEEEEDKEKQNNILI